MARSYFAILGVATSASPDEIRSAYRRLAKEYHPDCHDGDSAAFRQIQEAYATLIDAKRRAAYEKSMSRRPFVTHTDRARTAYSQPEPLVPEQAGRDLGNISPIHSFERYTPSLEEMYHWLWQNFFNRDQPKSGRGQQMTLEVPLTRAQAMVGGNARIMVPARTRCPACRGHGGVGFYECGHCAGKGIMSGELPVLVSFPPGLTQDHAVVIFLERFGIRNLHLTVLFRPRDQ